MLAVGLRLRPDVRLRSARVCIETPIDANAGLMLWAKSPSCMSHHHPLIPRCGIAVLRVPSAASARPVLDASGPHMFKLTAQRSVAPCG
jgi:hypothetical protein